jgi:hypothetical protein
VHCCGCEHSNAVSCIMAVSSCHSGILQPSIAAGACCPIALTRCCCCWSLPLAGLSDPSPLTHPIPAAAATTKTGEVQPDSPHFSGLVFKLQANMDPKHRDKVAFIRVFSGKFEKGMKVKVARTGRTVPLTAPQKMFANDRSTVQEGFAGGWSCQGWCWGMGRSGEALVWGGCACGACVNSMPGVLVAAEQHRIEHCARM